MYLLKQIKALLIIKNKTTNFTLKKLLINGEIFSKNHRYELFPARLNLINIPVLFKFRQMRLMRLELQHWNNVHEIRQRPTMVQLKLTIEQL